MVRHVRTKLFYDLDAAQAFGAEIDFIAETEEAMVLNKNETLESIFVNEFINPDAKEIGAYHSIKKEPSISASRDAYYVKYVFNSPRGSAKADFELAKRHAESYLNAKYEELGPDAGVSRA